MKQTRLNKLIAMLILFMMMFSNFGYTIFAIASSDGFQVITNGFFKKDEIEFSAYFENDGKKTDENISDVNKSMKLKMQILPEVEGYLKNASIKAVSSSETPINFKITSVQTMTDDIEEGEENSNAEEFANYIDFDSVENTTQNETVENEIETENVVESNDTVEVENTIIPEDIVENENTVSVNDAENTVENESTSTEETNTVQIQNSNTVDFSGLIDSTETQNIIQNARNNLRTAVETELQNEEESNKPTEDLILDSVQLENLPPIPNASEEEILIDEEKVIEEKMAEELMSQENLNSDIQIVADDEISLVNILKETTLVVEIEYVQNEELNIEDLYKEIRLQLSGTYINKDLEEVAVAKEDIVYVGWEYNKDIVVNSEYTKVSPFKIGDKTGTIVENKVTVKRNINDEKYLPLKSTTLEAIIPTFNGKMPIEIDVSASKLMATKCEDIGNTTFTTENWSYDKENGKITIQVINEYDGKAKNTNGEDEYVIIYRFEDYTEEITSKLEKNVKVTVEQYSAKENIIYTKELKENQEIDVNMGELITYSINTNEDKIQKSKIYANYNSPEAIYETEYRSNVSVNILTSDMLERLKIDCSKEVYKDVNGYGFLAEGIQYKTIRFNYSEIKNILSAGGNIEISNKNGEILSVLDNSVINTEDDCTINLNYADGIIVSVNNISVNGNLNFELTKVIKKCNFDKAAFKNFIEIESRVTAEVKYANLEETITLQEIGASKKFEESITKANLFINKENLTTIKENENVELKIELNNDKENSDLYVNPSFELVFPKYVKQVTVESINLIYENGLNISDFQTYTESDIVKMRVELAGTQTTFSENAGTNGTNILINVKIKMDEYTPSKEDQIKLYYCNEGVSNYESQTKWTISKQIPNGILKTTNGFDVALFNYQAPSGLVAINGIINYDGQLSEVKSVKQGTMTRQIAINSSSRIATMELLALNNTGNECSDIVMLGRVPFKGNKDVITNEDLKTTTNALMKDFIKEDIQNPNMVSIYYSTNENANKSFSDGANGWKTAENVEDISAVRSFLIVVKGNLKPGNVLRFTYDFEIPENLPYEASIAGSFGAYYNNNSDLAVVYESSRADIVGLTTEAGPKVEATLNVDIGDGASIGENRFLNYTLTVVNSGSVTAEGITIENPVPKYGTFYVYNANNGYGDDNYEATNTSKLTWTIGKLEPGETKTYNYKVKAAKIPDMVEYYSNELSKEIKQDENGYYYEEEIINSDIEIELGQNLKIEEEKEYTENTEEITDSNETTENENAESTQEPKEEEKEEPKQEKEYRKVYLDPVPDIYITNKAKITVSNLAIESKSNETKNLIKDANFGIEFNTEWSPMMVLGSTFRYMGIINNIADKDLKNVSIELKLPKYVKYEETEIYMYSHEEKCDTITYNAETHTVRVMFDEIYKDEAINVYIKATVIEGDNNPVETYLSIFTEDGIEERSTVLSRTYVGPKLEINQTTNSQNNSVLEGEDVEFVISIENTGNYRASTVSIVDEISENLKNAKSKITGSVTDTGVPYNGIIKHTIYELLPGGKVLVTISGKAADLDGVAKTISNKATISSKEIAAKDTNIINIEIKENPDKNDENESNNSNGNSGGNNEGNNQNNYVTDSNNSSNGNNSNNSNNSSGNNNSGNNQSSNNQSNSNSSNSNSNSNSNNTNNSNNQSTTNTQGNIHSVSGYVWLDENKNGRKEDTEKLMTALVVQLSKDGKTLKSTTTDGNGKYEFSGLTAGSYAVTFNYDKEIYKATAYKKANVEEDLNSDAVETASGKAVTNRFLISSLNIENMNFGLQNKDIFDLGISKYITNATVTVKDKKSNYKFDNLDLAKFEISSRDLKKAVVDIEYKIVIENIGNVEGTATSIKDYLPEDMTFDANKNKNSGWYLGKDGNVYNESLKETTLDIGEKKEIKLVLTKQMTEENTGVVNNKVEIVKAENKDGLEEVSDNNVSTQQTLISIKTGGIIIYTTSFVGIATIFTLGYLIATKKITINLKTFYKNTKSKFKIDTKKRYK